MADKRYRTLTGIYAPTPTSTSPARVPSSRSIYVEHHGRECAIKRGQGAHRADELGRMVYNAR